MNAGIGAKEVAVINKGLQETGEIQDVTVRFIEVLAENKRFMLIDEIADKYMKLYSTLNKEEKITIISAQALTKAEEGEVLSALKANPDNAGKSFTLEFQVRALACEVLTEDARCGGRWTRASWEACRCTPRASSWICRCPRASRRSPPSCPSSLTKAAPKRLLKAQVIIAWTLYAEGFT